MKIFCCLVICVTLVFGMSVFGCVITVRYLHQDPMLVGLLLPLVVASYLIAALVFIVFVESSLRKLYFSIRPDNKLNSKSGASRNRTQNPIVG